MSGAPKMQARLERLALNVANPARMAEELGAVFGMHFTPDAARLRSADGYELVEAPKAGLDSIVIGVSNLDEAIARLERAGAVRTADRTVDGRREVTYTGTQLGVPLTVRDSRPA